MKLSVVVPSHDRPLRLRWLLNALEEQTLARERWEVVVAHDSTGGETERLLATHPLTDGGMLRHVTFAPGRGPAEKRNAGWREATGDVVVFTDDDCRPPPSWLEQLVRAVEAHPGAIVQGTTLPDPDEADVLRSPYSRSLVVTPPTPYAETCNIAYPRDVLERLGGFDAVGFPGVGGEDADLAWRALAAGVPYEAAPEVMTYHAVEPMSVVRRAAFGWRWRQLPAMVRRHPELREHGSLHIFWTRRHARFALALAGVLLAPRRPMALALTLPWARVALPPLGRSPRARARSAISLPGQAAIDAVEFLALTWGSARHRTVYL